MFYVYILYSPSKDRFYIGQCFDLGKRLKDHNNGRSGYTKTAKDWQLKWMQPYDSRIEAVQIERKIKSKKSRKYLLYLIDGGRLD